MATWFNDNINIVTLVLSIVFFVAALITWATIDTSVEKGSGYVVPIMLVVAAAVSFIGFLVTVIKTKQCPTSESVADAQRRAILPTERALPTVPASQQPPLQQQPQQQQWQRQ